MKLLGRPTGPLLGALLASLAAAESPEKPEQKPPGLRFNGYVQGRYVDAQNAVPGTPSTGAPAVADGFNVRRARLRTTYEGFVSLYALEIDAVPLGVTVKDAEAHFIEPWTGKKIDLTVGQFKWPFGYELPQSDREREFPERARIVRTLFYGERDRGARLTVKSGPWVAIAGVFDGNGTDQVGYRGFDNDTTKDLVGRVIWEKPWLGVGLSGYYGETFRAPTEALGGKYFPRVRIGADLRTKVNLLPFGATAFKAEWMAGQTYQARGVELFDQTAAGWWALLVQNFGAVDALAVRYDFADPATGTSDRPSSTTPSAPASLNAVGTLGATYLHHFGDYLKASLTYEWPLTRSGGAPDGDPADNVFTFQLQAHF